MAVGARLRLSWTNLRRRAEWPMARITIRLYTVMDERLVKDVLTADASRLADAFALVERKYGQKFRKEFYEADGRIKGHYVVALNGRPMDREKAGGVEVADGDVLQIHPAFMGG